jgi:nickel-dependent lactate racemase
MNAQRQITGMFCGDLEKAHAAGVDFVAKQAVAFVDEPVDIVVTSSAGLPLDLTFYQAVKGLTAVLPIVKDGGTILIAAECAEGLGGPEFSELLCGTSSVDEFMARLADPNFFVIDQWQLQELCKVLRKAEVKLFSTAIAAEYGNDLLFGTVPSIEDGVEAAVKKYGEVARIAVVPKGPYVLTQVRSR